MALPSAVDDALRARVLRVLDAVVAERGLADAAAVDGHEATWRARPAPADPFADVAPAVAEVRAEVDALMADVQRLTAAIVSTRAAVTDARAQARAAATTAAEVEERALALSARLAAVQEGA